MAFETSQQFRVRWNTHLESWGGVFPQLLAGQRFVDVTLACEGHQLLCHRLVLAACSPYFENLLNVNHNQHPIVFLPPEAKLWQIQALVDYMYKGEVNVSQAGLPELLKCAETLQIRGLTGQSFDESNPKCHRTVAVTTTLISPKSVSDNGGKVNRSTPSPTPSTSGQTVNSPIVPNTTDADDLRIIEDPVDCVDLLEMEEGMSSGDDEASENRKDKLEGEFAMANVTCEYDGNSIQMDQTSPGRRIRRSETLLRQAAECVSRGQTFQTVSDMFNIPISTIRFFMARKGILPRRKRGRASTGSAMSTSSSVTNGSLQTRSYAMLQTDTAERQSRSVSPSEPPFHFVNYKLPDLKQELI